MDERTVNFVTRAITDTDASLVVLQARTLASCSVVTWMIYAHSSQTHRCRLPSGWDRLRRRHAVPRSAS